VVGAAHTHIRNEIGPSRNFLGNQQGECERESFVLWARPRRSAQGTRRDAVCWVAAISRSRANERAACARMTSATTPRALLFQRGKEARAREQESTQHTTYRLPTSSGCTGVRGQVPPLLSAQQHLMRAALREHCSSGAARHRSISYNAAKNGRRETLLIYCERRRCARNLLLSPTE
jgi:hypothetical protein